MSEIEKFEFQGHAIRIANPIPLRSLPTTSYVRSTRKPTETATEAISSRFPKNGGVLSRLTPLVDRKT